MNSKFAIAVIATTGHWPPLIPMHIATVNDINKQQEQNFCPCWSDWPLPLPNQWCYIILYLYSPDSRSSYSWIMNWTRTVTVMKAFNMWSSNSCRHVPALLPSFAQSTDLNCWSNQIFMGNNAEHIFKACYRESVSHPYTCCWACSVNTCDEVRMLEKD